MKRRLLPSCTSFWPYFVAKRGQFMYHNPKLDVEMGRYNFEKQFDEMGRRSGKVEDYTIKNYRKAYWRIDELCRRANHEFNKRGFFFLPTVEFPTHRGCKPLFSQEQFNFHYGRHHRAYVEKLNKLIEGTELYGLNLDELIIRTAQDPKHAGVYNNAAQHFNHCFFWKSLSPHGTNIPPDLLAALEKQYQSLDEFETIFKDAAKRLFGSGWVYFVWDSKLEQFDILSLENASCPLTSPSISPLMCLDVWEHAYYLDYLNDRSKYVDNFFDSCDWHWAERHWKRAIGQPYHEMAGW